MPNKYGGSKIFNVAKRSKIGPCGITWVYINLPRLVVCKEISAGCLSDTDGISVWLIIGID